MVYSLDMNSCAMAIRNFIARRGVSLEIFSDNGTNLKAAEKKQRESYQNLKMETLKQEFVGSETKWTFIPPASPWADLGNEWFVQLKMYCTTSLRPIKN